MPYITYLPILHKKGIKQKDVPKGHGACDAMVVLNMVDDFVAKQRVQTIISLDGKENKPVSVQDMFDCWTSMGIAIAQNPNLAIEFRKICESAAHIAAEVKEQKESGIIRIHH